MNASSEDFDGPSVRQTLESTHDLIDFYDAWPHLRTTSLEMLQISTLSGEQREVMKWLIKLADRITKLDLK